MRTHYCGMVTESLNKQHVKLSGWVHRRRDHGGVIFIDLRDRTGLVQVVCNPDNKNIFNIAEKIRNEYVIQVSGLVRPRPEGTVNADLATGAIEVLASDIVILNVAHDLPFYPDDPQVSEEVRLTYRYLDLRQPEMFNRFQFRSRVVQLIRNYLSAHGFIEVETPCLTKATPEGARDYLVPSRTHPGQFFALPQSPQIFKQLLMVAGFDRYYQIVRCFRDEDLRADRQPEFTQLDMEMSFIDENDLQEQIEDMVTHLFADVLNVSLKRPFLKMTYATAMTRYGSDKPDLRNPLELVDIDDLVATVDFKVFSTAANDKDSRVGVMRLPNGATLLTRKQLDDYEVYAKQFGAKGLAYIKVNDISKGLAGLQSPILKFLTEPVIDSILQRASATTGDIVFFIADKKKIADATLGALRIKVGNDLNLLEKAWKLLWVVDFPLFEMQDGHLSSTHHPFTAPNITDIAAIKADPCQVLSRAYDLVLNGTELGGGSIRIHNLELQLAIFELLGIEKEEAYDKFSHLLRSLTVGCPPLGGVAFGLDRLIMLLTNSRSLRDVIAFPKTQTAGCPLTAAPSPVSDAQMKELHIRSTVAKVESDKPVVLAKPQKGETSVAVKKKTKTPSLKKAAKNPVKVKQPAKTKKTTKVLVTGKSSKPTVKKQVKKAVKKASTKKGAAA